MARKRRTAAEAAELLASLGLDRGDEDEARARATIYFDGDSTEIAADYIDLVRNCVDQFKASLSGLLIVAGHAAGTDEPEQEVELSLQRTQVVSQLLEKLGVLSHQIVCVSRGANEPLVDPADSARRWINRRVEISEGALVPRPPAWAQQRRKKKAAAAAQAGADAQDDSSAERPGADSKGVDAKASASSGTRRSAGTKTTRTRKSS